MSFPQSELVKLVHPCLCDGGECSKEYFLDLLTLILCVIDYVFIALLIQLPMYFLDI